MKKGAAKEKKADGEQSTQKDEPGADSAWCTLESASSHVDSIKVSSDAYSIGRNAANDTVIKDKRISGKHCIVGREKDGKGEWTYFVEDLSTNGTFRNGKKVRSLNY